MVDTSVLVAGIFAFCRDPPNPENKSARVIRAWVDRRTFAWPDPGDEPFCACAEDDRADFIVTLNPGDFPARKLTVRVITPGDPLPGPRGSSRRRPAR